MALHDIMWVDEVQDMEWGLLAGTDSRATSSTGDDE